jgi:hypothetical protein
MRTKYPLKNVKLFTSRSLEQQSIEISKKKKFHHFEKTYHQIRALHSTLFTNIIFLKFIFKKTGNIFAIYNFLL